MAHSELTRATDEAKATNIATDMFVGLRGALAYALLVHARLMARVVSRQRVREPKRNIFPNMKPNGEVDVRSDSGRGDLTGDDDADAKGYLRHQRCESPRARALVRG